MTEPVGTVLGNHVLLHPGADAGPEAFEIFAPFLVLDLDTIECDVPFGATLLLDDLVPFRHEVSIEEVREGLERLRDRLLHIESRIVDHLVKIL